MTYAKDVVAVSAADHKQAALFFDHIFPLHSAMTVPSELKPHIPDFLGNEEAKFLVKFAETEPTSIDLSGAQTSGGDAQEGSLLGVPHMFGKLLEIINQENRLDISGSIEDRQYRFGLRLHLLVAATRTWAALVLAERFRQRGVAAVPVVANPVAELASQLRGEAAEVIEITLMQIPLVNTSEAEWAQILEFRADETSRMALRDFRLFAYEHYSGREPQYVRDDISRRLDAYEKACRKHGFDLVVSSVELLLDGKSLLGLGGLSLAALLSGDPKFLTNAAAAGVVIEAGRLLLHILKRKYALRCMREDHELWYMFKAQKEFGVASSK